MLRLSHSRHPLRMLLSSETFVHKFTFRCCPPPLLLKRSPPATELLFPLPTLHRVRGYLPIASAKLDKRVSQSAPQSHQSSRLLYHGSATVQAAGHDVTYDPEKLNLLKMKLQAEGIRCGSYRPGQYNNMLCPMCAGGQSTERSFSLVIGEDGELAMWTCFRAKCGWKGSLRASEDAKGKRDVAQTSSKDDSYRVIREENLRLQPLGPELIEYFKARMISAETLRRNCVMQQVSYDETAIAFTYRRNGTLVNCKYRTVSKKFRQEIGAEKIFYGLDDIKQAKDIIIVEGEIDKLSMEEAGYRNCVSVPDGAPPTVSKKELPSKEEDTKYRYLWNCETYLEQASRIILATDADAPGQALAEELSRRLGRERCWRVKWPKKGEHESEVCKDANEVLMYLGRDALRDAIEKAELYPIRGLYQFHNYFDEIDAYYNQNLGHELGVSTGWKALDELYKVVPGELTIVTGVPSSGKSEWIDALMVNLNEREGWKFAVCSMENLVREHGRKFLEKHLKKPFFRAGYGGAAERMSPEERERGKEWLNNTFYLIRCEDDALPSITWVLDLAKIAVLRHGVRGLVIDPYNELDHQRYSHQTETEYVSQMLTKIKRFAQHHSCHVWFVAHPRQLHNWGGEPPNLYDISGSAHFINKCDNGIVLHRNRDVEPGSTDLVQVLVRKVRNKVIGKIGEACLQYTRETGEFKDLDEIPKLPVNSGRMNH